MSPGATGCKSLAGGRPDQSFWWMFQNPVKTVTWTYWPKQKGFCALLLTFHTPGPLSLDQLSNWSPSSDHNCKTLFGCEQSVVRVCVLVKPPKQPVNWIFSWLQWKSQSWRLKDQTFRWKVPIVGWWSAAKWIFLLLVNTVSHCRRRDALSPSRNATRGVESWQKSLKCNQRWRNFTLGVRIWNLTWDEVTQQTWCLIASKECKWRCWSRLIQDSNGLDWPQHDPMPCNTWSAMHWLWTISLYDKLQRCNCWWPVKWQGDVVLHPAIAPLWSTLHCDLILLYYILHW